MHKKTLGIFSQAFALLPKFTFGTIWAGPNFKSLCSNNVLEEAGGVLVRGQVGNFAADHEIDQRYVKAPQFFVGKHVKGRWLKAICTNRNSFVLGVSCDQTF